MNKILPILLTSWVFLNAGLINAIAIVVNETPITLYDIDQKMITEKMTKEIAVSSLVDEVLYEQELRKNTISVDIFDIDNYIEKLAVQNKMTSLEFKALVRQQEDYDKFKENIKKQLLHQKLIKKIAGGKLTIASDEDMNIFYESNKEQFKIADTIDVIAYVSKNKKLLNSIKINPMLQDKNVMVQSISLKQSELNPQVKYVLNTTEAGKFSAVFAQNKNYNMFFVKDKKDVETISFENVKDKIFQNIMKTREQNYLKDYFETLKITADIKVLR
ncbi:MAG: SurA N-terminal domain-containing protein [Campylobacterota bacterium]|nr:SurA N-terminal domain-containing protein [Campylobacterota bacterium]